MTTTEAPPAQAVRIRAGDPRYFEVVEFLEDEASLLDDNRIMEWVGVMAPDLVYRMPVRVTRLRDDELPDSAPGMYHFDENHLTLSMKVARLEQTASPWAENPRSRTRRFVTNIKVFATDEDSEYEVTSSVLLIRSRYDHSELEVFSAARRDLVRLTPDGYRLARRIITPDQSTLGLANLAIFL